MARLLRPAALLGLSAYLRRRSPSGSVFPNSAASPRGVAPPNADAAKRAARYKHGWLSAAGTSPRGRTQKVWDALLLFVLLYTLAVTPFELAFMKAPWPNVPYGGSPGAPVENNAASGPVADIYPWAPSSRLAAAVYIFNRLADAVFLGDVVWNLQARADGGGNPRRRRAALSPLVCAAFSPLSRLTCARVQAGVHISATRVERDVRVLSLLYLRGWFCLDLVSALPWDLMAPQPQLRALRVINLLRVARLPRLIARVESKFARIDALRLVKCAWLPRMRPCRSITPL